MIASLVLALVSAQVCGGGEAEAYGVSTGGEFGGYGWVRSGDVTTFSHGVLVGVVSAPARSDGLSSWCWVKSSLGVETFPNAVLTSSCICTISSMIFSSSGLLYELAVEFFHDFT